MALTIFLTLKDWACGFIAALGSLFEKKVGTCEVSYSKPWEFYLKHLTSGMSLGSMTNQCHAGGTRDGTIATPRLVEAFEDRF